MKILFISPGWPKGRLWGELTFKFPSLSLAAIAAVTPPEWELEFCDDNHEQVDYSTDADIVALTAMTAQITRAYEIADAFRARGKTVVIGGFHASNMPEEARLHSDAVVIGEGEQTFYELAAAGCRNVETIPGIGYRKEGVGTLSGVRELIPDLDSLPFPAYHLLPEFPRRYFLPLFSYPKAPNTSIISSRGCPYQCSYCDRSVFKQGFRYNSADYIYAHMQYLKARFGVRHVNIYDDLFTLNRKRIAALCEQLCARPLGLQFNCAVRVGHADDELLALTLLGLQDAVVPLGAHALQHDQVRHGASPIAATTRAAVHAAERSESASEAASGDAARGPLRTLRAHLLVERKRASPSALGPRYSRRLPISPDRPRPAACQPARAAPHVPRRAPRRHPARS